MQTADLLLEVEDFDAKLMEALEEVITELLGSRILAELYGVLFRRCNLTRTEIPSRLDDFSSALLDIFGAKAAGVLSCRIARRFSDKLNLTFEPYPYQSLFAQIEIAKNKLCQEKLKRN